MPAPAQVAIPSQVAIPPRQRAEGRGLRPIFPSKQLFGVGPFAGLGVGVAVGVGSFRYSGFCSGGSLVQRPGSEHIFGAEEFSAGVKSIRMPVTAG
jgi:hypothetical protein